MNKLFRLVVLSLAAMVCPSASFAEPRWPAETELVVRVWRLTASPNADKYAWYKVKVVQVLKNETGAKLPYTLDVAAYSWKPGVPAGESTLYLEGYNPALPSHWMLVGGEASTGVATE